jgi:hypothetical protein
MLWAARGMGLLILVAGVPLLGLSQNTSPAPTGTGSVVGIVVDSDGKRIADANVYALPAQNMTQRFSALSDAEGKFTIKGIPISDDCGWCHTAYVQAYKDSDGYPDKVFAFYHTVDSEVAKVEIEANKAPPFVVVQMGPKTSHLTLVITDPDGRHTGASVIFTRDGFPQGIYRRGVGVDETVPVPAVPFRVTVEAEGYEPWHYGGAKWQGDAGLVNLKPGQTLSLDVRLRKK